MARFMRSPKLTPGKTADTKILFHFDGASGSTVFTNEGAIGGVGTPASTGASVSVDKSAYGNASMFCSGTNSYITMPYSSANQIGTGSGGLEFSFAYTSSSTSPVQIYSDYNTTSHGIMIALNKNYGYPYPITFEDYHAEAGGSTGYVVMTASTQGVFQRVQVVKNSTIVTVYLNDALQYTYTTTAAWDSTRAARFGASSTGTCLYTGYLDEFRLEVGSAPLVRVPRKAYY